MTRDDALERLKKSELDEQTLKNEFEYIANKLKFLSMNYNIFDQKIKLLEL